MSTARPDENRFERRALANQIDSICDEFERRWIAGEDPRIESYLDRVSTSHRMTLLSELLSVELELRGDTANVDIADYVTRFPDDEELVRRVALSIPPTCSATIRVLAEVLESDREAQQPPTCPWKELREAAVSRRFRRGEYLLRQGEQATSLLVVRRGTVEIHVEDDARATHVVGRVGPGQVIGEMALLTSAPRTASAIACESGEVAVLPAETFHQICDRHPHLSSVLTGLIADRLGQVQHDALTDKRLDRYRIRRRLGRGGMSVVYEAHDTECGRQVALKMMSHRLVGSPAALRRFQCEADLIEQFHHPNIVRMYHRFSAFRTYFIAMEYCRGMTLARHLRLHGAMHEPILRSTLGQIAKALQHAHDAGIVHRDIKPSNIMWLNDGALKLMDFGLAEPADKRSCEGDEVVGTPRYMAPEQREGSLPDRRADYFSLGCVAYELLSGTPLFAGDPVSELQRDFSTWQPPDLARLRAPLHPETVSSLQLLLSPHPADRGIDLRQIAAWAD